MSGILLLSMPLCTGTRYVKERDCSTLTSSKLLVALAAIVPSTMPAYQLFVNFNPDLTQDDSV